MRLNPKHYLSLSLRYIICTADASNDGVDSIAEVTQFRVCSYRLSFIFIKIFLLLNIYFEIKKYLFCLPRGMLLTLSSEIRRRVFRKTTLWCVEDGVGGMRASRYLPPSGLFLQRPSSEHLLCAQQWGTASDVEERSPFVGVEGPRMPRHWGIVASDRRGSPFLGCGRSEDTQSMKVFGDRRQESSQFPSSLGSAALRQACGSHVRGGALLILFLPTSPLATLGHRCFADALHPHHTPKLVTGGVTSNKF